MTGLSLVICGAIGIGFLAMLFLLHELRNAPYDDGLEPERVLSELEKQRLRYLSLDSIIVPKSGCRFSEQDEA
ncbi:MULTISPECIES: hypothetical protein [Methylobacteriaceae]|uniref:hypothetical protein n=1 Tax=Methylobacteriaceae TaxID=119045 RepID=UPI00074FA6B8|nr:MULTISPECIES: hypothetical protein [Methylobacteriaceae]AMB47963.1 hypothetical protein Y590_23665 [Methylobacterium sp. AMS5]TFZ58405.1 hypothetical protein E4V01_11785 [Methylorubrum sp. Q1]